MHSTAFPAFGGCEVENRENRCLLAILGFCDRTVVQIAHHRALGIASEGMASIVKGKAGFPTTASTFPSLIHGQCMRKGARRCPSRARLFETLPALDRVAETFFRFSFFRQKYCQAGYFWLTVSSNSGLTCLDFSDSRKLCNARFMTQRYDQRT